VGDAVDARRREGNQRTAAPFRDALGAAVGKTLVVDFLHLGGADRLVLEPLDELVNIRPGAGECALYGPHRVADLALECAAQRSQQQQCDLRQYRVELFAHSTGSLNSSGVIKGPPASAAATRCICSSDLLPRLVTPPP